MRADVELAPQSDEVQQNVVAAKRRLFLIVLQKPFLAVACAAKPALVARLIRPALWLLVSVVDANST